VISTAAVSINRVEFCTHQASPGQCVMPSMTNLSRAVRVNFSEFGRGIECFIKIFAARGRFGSGLERRRHSCCKMLSHKTSVSLCRIDDAI